MIAKLQKLPPLYDVKVFQDGCDLPEFHTIKRL